MTIDDSILAGTPWTSPPCKEYFVFWEDVLKVRGRDHRHLSRALAQTLGSSELPLVSVLVSASINMWDFLKQLDAAPNVEEITIQLAALRLQLERLGSLAQGGTGRARRSTEPQWITDHDGRRDRAEIDHFIRASERRSASLHPILKYWIEAALSPDTTDDFDEFAREQSALRIDASQRKLVEFFDSLPDLILTLSNAEKICARNGAMLHKQRRTLGAPGDASSDWLFVQLMWIWRDVLDNEVSIYARRIRAGVELDTLEPQGCMEFIVRVMHQAEAIKPHQLSALERKLNDLSKLIPTAKLAVPVSRGN